MAMSLLFLPDELCISDEKILFWSGYVRAYAWDVLVTRGGGRVNTKQTVPSISSNIPRHKQDVLIADVQLIREEEEEELP